ncbi:ABC transporter ATP-binding protein [Candidatus Bathyarchaeota archaeon]|mgnify:CR=1 FL=1|nr:MAG: ABC transporter ATP-binding protein [Candidatus Bathyarchaeota archaeon]
MPAVEARGLVKKIGRKLVLRGVGFEVSEGEVLGLLGPNGAGKTTTVRILMGILRPDEGSATVMGHDVLEEPLEVRRCVGYLPEVPCLYERLTVEDNLAFYGGLYDIPRAELEKRISELLSLMGLEERAGEPVGALSKGLKQRVAIARALIHDPPVLFLDQPTSDLDPASARSVRELIVELNRSGKTVLICTHNLKEAEDLCDRVAIISGGRILAVGEPDELLGGRRYYSFELRVRGRISGHLGSLRSSDGVMEVKQVGPDKALLILDEREAISGVVRRLVEDGCDILEVKMVGPSLEDIYMRLVGAHEAG